MCFQTWLARDWNWKPILKTEGKIDCPRGILTGDILVEAHCHGCGISPSHPPLQLDCLLQAHVRKACSSQELEPCGRKLKYWRCALKYTRTSPFLSLSWLPSPNEGVAPGECPPTSASLLHFWKQRVKGVKFPTLWENWSVPFKLLTSGICYHNRKAEHPGFFFLSLFPFLHVYVKFIYLCSFLHMYIHK